MVPPELRDMQAGMSQLGDLHAFGPSPAPSRPVLWDFCPFLAGVLAPRLIFLGRLGGSA